ncbi:MAG TPA: SGNH/GDSL hydrolase family protein [Nocardioidaceae bacterium]|nr:SGNH/GDSL hydrolase family protein [Nocardioidaceae bacterium]
MPEPPVPRTFMAVGDSFSEGLDDPGDDGGYRGWADRLAERFAASDSTVRYANLAIRGRRIGQIVEEQIPRAIELKPELVSFAGGTNDVLRPRVDIDEISRLFDGTVRRLRENGSQVMLFQSVDPTSRSRIVGRTLPRIKALTTLVEETAARYDCVLVPLWSAPVFAHPDAWSEDRLHLSAIGHERVTRAALEALGMGDGTWADPLPWRPREPLGTRVGSDVRWARRHLAPWLGRRLRGTSSGDLIVAKRPDLAPVR